MAVSRAEQRAFTRQSLLAEGRRRFAADGYHHVVLAEVARAVGVTKGAAYHHFDSKSGLFRAVVSEVQQELGEQVAASAERYQDLWEQFRAGCRAFLAAGTDPAVRQILLVDAPTVLGWDEWRALDEVLRPAPRGGPSSTRRSRNHRRPAGGAPDPAALGSDERGRALDRARW